MKNVAIIPARGESKRIPRKNIKDFLGKPIIDYSIEAALESKLFDEVMVSTDDEEIAIIAKKFGAKVPFFRSKKNSDDYATTPDVIEEVISNYKDRNINFDIFCCIYPAAPFITKENLIKGYQLLIDANFDSVFPVLSFAYPIQRALVYDKNKIKMIWTENYTKRTQDLQKTYHDSGQFYWMWSNKFFKEKKMFTENSGAFVLPANKAQDIDTLEDWELAEMKYQILFNKK